MPHDTSFASNPFDGILSLATCKLLHRLTKQTGDNMPYLQTFLFRFFLA
ncbi:hypothetical protein [Niastella vici]